MTALHKLFTGLLAAALSLTSLYAQSPQDELTGMPSLPVVSQPQLQLKKSASSLSLPFFEDFSGRDQKPDPQLWEDDQVYISATMPISPPSIGAAVFDGLDKWGLAYDINSQSQDSCDVLTSRPINLSNPTDSVYLSFHWQAGGHGEEPESTDSLQLEFYNPAEDAWYHAWSIAGVNSTAFQQVLVPVKNSFHQDSFRFRFRNYGLPAGAFDTWLVDYIELNDERDHNDTLPPFEDPAFTRPHPSLLQDYEAIPYFHYTTGVANSLNKDEITFYYQESPNSPPPYTSGDPIPLSLGIYQISYNGNILASDPNGNPSVDNGLGYFQEESYTDTLYGPFLIPNLPVNQEFHMDAYQTYFGQGTSFSSNDTVRRKQEFSNYYAYDDGTAERAYQVSDNGGGVIVTRFKMQDYVDDIMGLYIYFFPSEYDVTDNEFTIVIYRTDQQGRPGQLIYESDSVYTPQLSETNYFMPYALDTTVSLTQTDIFVGIRQQKNTRLPIGFDRNNVQENSFLFYGYPASGQIFESFRKGTLMMRPYLRYQPADLSKEETKVLTNNAPEIFPNPASNWVKVKLPEDDKDYFYSLIDLGGRSVQQGRVKDRIDFGNRIQSGAYILRIEDPSGQNSPYTTKILIQR